MGFRFICPSTGRKIEASCQVDDEDLMLRTENIAAQCSFCGGSHEWVFVQSTQREQRRSHRKVATLRPDARPHLLLRRSE